MCAPVYVAEAAAFRPIIKRISAKLRQMHIACRTDDSGASLTRARCADGGRRLDRQAVRAQRRARCVATRGRSADAQARPMASPLTSRPCRTARSPFASATRRTNASAPSTTCSRSCAISCRAMRRGPTHAASWPSTRASRLSRRDLSPAGSVELNSTWTRQRDLFPLALSDSIVATRTGVGSAA